MKKLVLACLFAAWMNAYSQDVFINELHYDNTGADAGEGVEIAGPAGTPLNGYSIFFYNGNTGLIYMYTSVPSTDTIPNEQNGYGTVFVPLPGLQNGSPDGVALIYGEADSVVLQFLSYEGSFTAMEGLADGMISEDIGVAESGSTPIGYSLQLAGEGTHYGDFTWTTEMAETYDSINAGQCFGSCGADSTESAVVWINEIHYDNDGTDINEGIEIAGTAGANLAGWQLILYNGNGGAAYSTIGLSGILPDQEHGYGVRFFPADGIQNGGPDGIALVDPNALVVQFISYEGSFTAVGSPADGLLSEAISASEGSGTPAGFSLQLVGTGSSYEDFSWEGPVMNTFGSLNTGQHFGGIIGDPSSDTVSIGMARTLPLFTEVVVSGIVTVSDQFGGPAYLQDATGGIPVFDVLLHGSGLFEIGDSVMLRASVGIFNQQIQLTNIDTVISYGPGMQVISQTIQASQLAAYEGLLVTVDSITFNDPGGLLYPNSNFIISDGTANVQLRIDGNTDLVGFIKPQGVTSVTGVVGRFQSDAQLLPRFQPDLPGAMEFVPEGAELPYETTLDVATWNMEFFGSELPDFGPANVELQKQNAIAVIQALHADIIAVQEVSDEALLDEVVAALPGFQRVCSQVYSYSFQGPDPTFPPQKLCFLYDTGVIQLRSEQVLFDQFYTQARLGVIPDLNNHPGGDAQSFWSSGRLPYMVTVEAKVGGTQRQIRLINIHAKSGSGSNDQMRRVYDIRALKDTLDTYYSTDALIILGDYNDDVDESIGGGPSTYQLLLDDTDGYTNVTGSLSALGFRSYLFADNMIDHLTFSNELDLEYLDGSEQTLLPFLLIDDYSGTTSDHLPVSGRFELSEPVQADAGEDQLVYLGYEPLSSVVLTAAVSGGAAPYTYLWSTGASGPSVEVMPADTTDYVVFVTDANGNSAEDTVRVNVLDVHCERGGHQMVEVCFKGQTFCLPEQAVTALTGVGASVGACGSVAPMVGAVSVGPNPFQEQFNLNIESFVPFGVQITVYTLFGTVSYDEVFPLQEGQNSLPIHLAGQRRGLYFLKIIDSTTGVVLDSFVLIKK